MLVRSWTRHEASWLKDYLVAGVEDPRLNLQSILSRHFLINELAPARFASLMRQEYYFAAAMDWLLRGSGLRGDPEACLVTLDALRRGSDNAEGLEIPGFLVQTFAGLPAELDGCVVPNYLEKFLLQPTPIPKPDIHGLDDSALNTYAVVWQTLLQKEFSIPAADQPGDKQKNSMSESAAVKHTTGASPPTLLEPACGSANDYRFLHRYGLARMVRYSGFDLCEKNIDNARGLFPDACFQTANVFEIPQPSKSFDFCIVHDLFEHLSLAGLEQAVREICRVTRWGLCLGFFQMDEIPEHIVRPHEEYHWNLLSLPRMKRLFTSQGFASQAIHVGSFLSHHTGCQDTHNPNAYTLILRSLSI